MSVLAAVVALPGAAHLPGVIQRWLAGSRGWLLTPVAVVWDGRVPLCALG